MHFARFIPCITFNCKHIVHLYSVHVKRIFYFFKHFNGKLSLTCMYYWYIYSTLLVCTYHITCTLLSRTTGLPGKKTEKQKKSILKFQ